MANTNSFGEFSKEPMRNTNTELIWTTACDGETTISVAHEPAILSDEVDTDGADFVMYPETTAVRTCEVLGSAAATLTGEVQPLKLGAMYDDSSQGFRVTTTPRSL